MKNLFLVSFLALSFALKAQDTLDIPESDSSKIYNIGELAQNPEYNGGMGEFYQYIASNYKQSTKSIAEGACGTIYVQFIVMKTGEIDQVKILRGVHPDLDLEAVRVLYESETWEPAQNYEGDKVACRFAIPIKITCIKTKESKNKKHR